MQTTELVSWAQRNSRSLWKQARSVTDFNLEKPRTHQDAVSVGRHGRFWQLGDGPHPVTDRNITAVVGGRPVLRAPPLAKAEEPAACGAVTSVCFIPVLHRLKEDSKSWVYVSCHENNLSNSRQRCRKLNQENKIHLQVSKEINGRLTAGTASF